MSQAKKQGNAIYNLEKNSSVETHLAITQMIELVDKNITAIIIIVFYIFKKLKNKY